MYTTKSEVVNNALSLANRNLVQLQHVAWLSINEFGYSSTETVVICAQYSTDWSDLILEINPNASKEAKAIVARGRQPISIMSTRISALSDLLEKTTADIELPTISTDFGLVNLLMLTEGGHYLWLQILPRSNLTLLS